MKNLLIVALAFLSTSAFAFGDQGQAQGQLQGQAQGQIQGQAQGQGQAQFSQRRQPRPRPVLCRGPFPVGGQQQSVRQRYTCKRDSTLTVNEAKIPENTRNEQAGTVEREERPKRIWWERIPDRTLHGLFNCWCCRPRMGRLPRVKLD